MTKAQGKPQGRPLTIKRSALGNLRMAAGNEKRHDLVIMNGSVIRWVGIGWIDEGEPTARQRKSLPVVID